MAKQHQAMNDSLKIRTACKSDVPAMFEIMTNSLDEEFLKYTIYQAPQSVNYLSNVVTSTTNSYAFVICEADKILGFTTIRSLESDLHLNYIAVINSAQGKGIGRKLLEHYELIGQLMGKSSFSLNVFENNIRARNWYLSHGYEIGSKSFCTLLRMDQAFGKAAYSIELDDEELAQAYELEKQIGMSNIECSCGPGKVTVGFIAGTLCNLLDYSVISQSEAVAAIYERFHSVRETLLITSIPVVPQKWPIKSIHRVLHLTKTLNAHANTLLTL